MSSDNPKEKVPKFVGHELLDSFWNFVEVPNEDWIVGVKVNVVKVFRLDNRDGSPYLNPQSKRPMYTCYSSNQVEVFSREEYEEQMQITKRKMMK